MNEKRERGVKVFMVRKIGLGVRLFWLKFVIVFYCIIFDSY